MEAYLEELLKSASTALDEGTAVGERGATYYLVDFYKNVLDEAGEALSISGIQAMPIKHKILNLGAKLPEIHSFPEFREVEKIRQKHFHADRGSPERTTLERLVENGSEIAEEVIDAANRSKAQLTDAKEMGDVLKLRTERAVAELKEWVEAVEPFSSLVGENEIKSMRKNLSSFQEVAASIDPKALKADWLRELIRMLEAIDHAKYLYEAGEAMAIDLAAESYGDFY